MMAATRRTLRADARLLQQKIGLPEEKWTLITLPCFLTLDWDNHHDPLRQALSMPRISEKQMREEELAVCKDLNTQITPEVLANPETLSVFELLERIEVRAGKRIPGPAYT
jgi:hypothetical protein